jgi:hypothetical protein
MCIHSNHLERYKFCTIFGNNQEFETALFTILQLSREDHSESLKYRGPILGNIKYDTVRYLKEHSGKEEVSRQM